MTQCGVAVWPSQERLVFQLMELETTHLLGKMYKKAKTEDLSNLLTFRAT